MTIALNNITHKACLSLINRTAKLIVLFFCVCFHNNTLAQKWVQLPDFPGSKRDDGVGVFVNNTCFFGTGLQEGWSATIDFYALDAQSLSWRSIATMPHTTERQYACAFAGKNCFFVFGGDGIGGALNSLYKYDIAGNNWTAMAPKPGKGLSGASCMVFGDSVIIVGGRSNGVSNTNNEVWLYNITTNTWTRKNDFPFGGRWRGNATVLHKKGYYLFGLDSMDRYRRELFAYQIGNDTWQQIGYFGGGAGRTYAAMVAATEQLVVFGGKDSLNAYYNDTWYYNDQTQTWIKDVSLPSFGRKGGMYASDGRQLFYACGINQSDQRLNESWMTDIPLTVKAYEKNDIRVSLMPNPCTTHVTLNVLGIYKNNWHYSILNTNGYEVVAETKLNFSSESIDLGKLMPGLYFLKICDENGGVGIQKVLKLEQ